MTVEKKIITVIEPEGPEDWYGSLAEKTDLRFFYPTAPLTPEQVQGFIAESDGVIITASCGISAEDLACTDRLGIIAKCGGKPSNVDIDEATKRGVAVSYVPGANTTTVAEYAVMTILTSLRRFPLITTAIQKELNRNTTNLFGRELREKTVGLVGFGPIGREVAKRLAGFDCRVLVFDPFYEPTGTEPECVSFSPDLDTVMKESDAVSVHCVLNESTKGLIGEGELALMKPEAGIVNCARGPIIDEDALERFMKEGRLAFAVLDVFSVEPPASDHPLIDVENVTLTPHLSSWTPEALHREVRGAVESVEAWMEGRDIPGLINPDYGKNLQPE